MRVNGKALRAIRERSGMTIKALADAVGMDPNHLSNVEALRRQTNDEVILALAKTLKVELPAILLDPNEAPESVA